MHHDEWNEAHTFEALPDVCSQVIRESFLNVSGLLDHSQTGRLCAARPRAVSAARQTVIVDHRRRSAFWIFLEMVYDISPHGRPGPNAAAPLAQARIAYDSSAYGVVTPRD